MDERLDLVVFGATGFTGKYVVKYIGKRVQERDRTTGTKLRWGAAGRSAKKIQEFLAEAAKDKDTDLSNLQVIVAEVDDVESLKAMCAKAKVVINCVGPFQRMGEVVVRACIENGADYVDITGEPLFIDTMIHKYSGLAASNGRTIIPSCGFDSVPADVGTQFTVSQFKDPALCSSVESYLYVNSGPKGLVGNYGTYDSLVDGFSNASLVSKLRKEMNRPQLSVFGPRLKRHDGLRWSKEFGRYVLPFPGSDATVVRDSQFFYQQNPQEYPRPVQFGAYFMFKSLFSVVALGVFDFLVRFLVRFRWGKHLLKTYPEWLTLGTVRKTGPTQEQIDGCSFTTTLIGRGFKNEQEINTKNYTWKVVTKVAGPEVGYVTTPICVCEAAFALLDLKGSGAIPSGVLTPAVAFAKTDYIKRLNENGVTFSIVSEGPDA